MPKLRRLSGAAVIAILEGFGFIVIGQVGSHVKLRRVGPAGEKQTFDHPAAQRTGYRHTTRHLPAGKSICSCIGAACALFH